MLNTRPMQDEVTKKSNFNFNKLEAVACILASAALTVALIVLAFRAFS